MTVGVVGLGLIGGSFGAALRARGVPVLGHDRDAAHEAEALELGLVDAAARPDDLARRCDLVAVAVPVQAIASACRGVLDVGGAATVVELGSTKDVLAKALAGHPDRARLVHAHPMAGTEFSGPTAARPDLFAGATCVLCDLEATSPPHAERARGLLHALGMRLVELPSGPHDLHAAYVSHISHISSFALSLTVLAKERDERQIFNLAAGGFASTVRLAKSNPDTWTPIFEQNRDHVLDVLDEYITVLSGFRSALIKRDFARVHELMRAANAIAPILARERAGLADSAATSSTPPN